MKTNRIILLAFGVIIIASGLYLLPMFSEKVQITDEKVDSSPQEPSKPQAKIDPRVACESALAYTTFSSGEEADAFVKDCIEGKYPEVIERYIQDMGLDGKTL